MKRRLLWLILLVPTLLVAAAAVAWTWLWHTESGAAWAWNQAVERLADSPRGARLDARIEGTLKRGLRLREVVYRDPDVTVQADIVSLAGGVSFSPLRIVLSSLSVGGLEVVVAAGDDDDTGQAFPPPDLDLGLPLPHIVRQLQIDDAVVRRGAFIQRIDALSGRLRWFEEARLEITRLETPEVSGALKLSSALTPPFSLQSEMRVTRLTLPEQVGADLPWLSETLSANWTVQGDIEALDVEGTLSWPDWLAHANFEGRLDQPLQDLSWRLELDAPQASIPGDWGEVGLRAVNIESNGDSGRVIRWSATGEADVRAKVWPSGRVNFEASGEGDRLSATVDAPELFGGSLTLVAQVEQLERTPWEATLTANGVGTAPLIEALAPHVGVDHRDTLESVRTELQAEVLDARIEAQGLLDPVQASIRIERAAANILGRDMRASGSLEITEGDVLLEHLVIDSGNSRIAAEGSFSGPPGLKLDIAAADIGDFLPGTAGRLDGTVFYTHDPERGLPGSRLRANLQGDGLQAFEWRVGTLKIAELSAGDMPPLDGASSDPLLALSLDAGNIDGPAGPIESVSARMAGSFERQVLIASARIREIDIETTLAGGPDNSGWSGLLERLKIMPPESGYWGPPWSLREPVPIAYVNGAAVNDACLITETGASVCLDFESRPDGSQQGTLDMTSMTPDLVAPLAAARLSFSQRLDGRLDWSRPAAGALSADGRMTISEGLIVDEAADLELLHTREGTIRFTMEQGSLTSGMVDLPFQGGTIEADLAVPGLLTSGDATLDGRIRVEVSDLRPLSSFAPQLAQTAGTLTANIRVAGTGADPQFSGNVRLAEGRANVVVSGTRLSEVEVDGRLNANNRLQVDGRFRAGEGAGRLRGTIDLSDPLRPLFDGQLTGDGLGLVDVPDLSLKADANVEADWNGEALELSGHIHVPSARFAPSYLPSDTASESPDVVVVAGEDDRANGTANGADWNIRGELEISMGDDVVIDLELARATMTGSVTFNWNGGRIPMANGEYTLQGEIQAYGQQLEITRALIRYPNVPANNPHLDIRGERRIYGNSLINRAGVFVHGTLKRPVTEPYTVPATNADRARALLITGSDFNYEQGVGAVNVGTYIAPKLYLSYGVGLFEEGNVISARYELKSNFGVKATSGQDETGIDISYTIEK